MKGYIEIICNRGQELSTLNQLFAFYSLSQGTLYLHMRAFLMCNSFDINVCAFSG